MNSRITIFCSLLSALTLTACGQSGALYLPDKAPKKHPLTFGSQPAAAPAAPASTSEPAQPASVAPGAAPIPVPAPATTPAPVPAPNQETP